MFLHKWIQTLFGFLKTNLLLLDLYFFFPSEGHFHFGLFRSRWHLEMCVGLAWVSQWSEGTLAFSGWEPGMPNTLQCMGQLCKLNIVPPNANNLQPRATELRDMLSLLVENHWVKCWWLKAFFFFFFKMRWEQTIGIQKQAPALV